MNNKTLGNTFEQDFLKHLSKLGYWATFLEDASYSGRATM